LTSPFLVLEDFMSPMRCEDLVDECEFFVPDTDIGGTPISSRKTCETAQSIIYHRLIQDIPIIESTYSVQYRGMESMEFEWYPTESFGQVRNENSAFINNKWARINTRDFTGVLFLTDYQDNVPFDGEYEVYGGKLEFPRHGFSFNPKRGTLVIFPSDPRFSNATSHVFVGEAVQVRIQMVMTTPYKYDPRQFPGDFRSWFASAGAK